MLCIVSKPYLRRVLSHRKLPLLQAGRMQLFRSRQTSHVKRHTSNVTRHAPQVLALSDHERNLTRGNVLPSLLSGTKHHRWPAVSPTAASYTSLYVTSHACQCYRRYFPRVCVGGRRPRGYCARGAGDWRGWRGGRFAQRACGGDGLQRQRMVVFLPLSHHQFVDDINLGIITRDHVPHPASFSEPPPALQNKI
jgi:hypothetical protein